MGALCLCIKPGYCKIVECSNEDFVHRDGVERRMIMSNYMAIIHKEPNGWYSAEVPALPGCYTDGATLDEIHMNLKDAIQLYLQDQPENVEPVEMMQVCV